MLICFPSAFDILNELLDAMRAVADGSIVGLEKGTASVSDFIHPLSTSIHNRSQTCLARTMLSIVTFSITSYMNDDMSVVI